MCKCYFLKTFPSSKTLLLKFVVRVKLFYVVCCLCCHWIMDIKLNCKCLDLSLTQSKM